MEAVHTSTPTDNTAPEDSTTIPQTVETTTYSTPSTAPADTPPSTDRITAVGDSVMVGAAGELQQAMGDPVIDAKVDRQASTVVDILRNKRESGRLGEVVVVHLGNNGPFTAEQFDEMMRVLSGARKVVFVNVKVPRPWEQPNNDVLADGISRYANTVLIDWHAASADRPELFADDGYHLQPEGQQIYANLVAAGLPTSS